MTQASLGGMAPMPPLDDLYNVDHVLSEEERMVRDRIRLFVQERVLPVVGSHFAAETFPRDLVPELASLGLLGMQIKGYGCAGQSAVTSRLSNNGEVERNLATK